MQHRVRRVQSTRLKATHGRVSFALLVALTGATAAACSSENSDTNGEFKDSTTLIPGQGPVRAATQSANFGETRCGSGTGGGVVTLTNDADEETFWTASLVKGVESPYQLTASGGVLPARGSVQIEVQPNRTSTQEAAGALVDTLRVRTLASPDSSIDVNLEQTLRGPVVRSSASALLFDATNLSTPRRQEVVLTNSGNEVAHLLLSTDLESFRTDPKGLVEIPPGQSLAIGVELLPSDLGALTGTLAWSSPDALCAPLPPPLPLVAQVKDSPVQLTAGAFHTCARLASGRVACWGGNSYGQIGDGTEREARTPEVVRGLTDAIDVSASVANTCAVRSNGHIACWGSNLYGQLGDGTLESKTLPQDVPGLTDVRSVATGFEHVCALKTDGSVWCWGNSDYGQLGTGNKQASKTPVMVPIPNDVIHLAASNLHTCALRADKTVWCWGHNDDWQLSSEVAESLSPMQVQGLTDVAQVTAALTHTCARKTDGTVWCWGNNNDGELGDGSDTDSSVPRQAVGLSAVTFIDGDWEHTCAVRENGTTLCWGEHEFGALGNGVQQAPLVAVPEPMLDLEDAVSIATGKLHTCVLRRSGSVECTGANGDGQLGDGTTASAVSLTPVNEF